MSLCGKHVDVIKVRVQEIPQVQFVQQCCRHASGSAASGADGVEQQKLRDNESNKIVVLK